MKPVGDMGVKFDRSVSDLNIPKEKNFGGPRVKFGELDGSQTFFFPPFP